MGQVYRARDTRLAREVAVKILQPEYASDADRLQRFQIEALAVSALNHPSILTIYDIGTAEGVPYLVTELLEGQTLRQRMGGAALPAWRTVDYALQIAHGLAAAHEKHIVHRDLKPENLFVTKDERIKILDFGLAKLARPELGSGSTLVPNVETGTGLVVGTVGYMSPEQVTGVDADHRSDIFAFGAILYEMVAGRRAFRGASSVETLNAILKEEPPDLSHEPGAVSIGVERIVRHCLQKSPEARFQAARDLAFALQEVLANATPPVRPAAEAVTPSPTGSGVPISSARPAKSARRWLAIGAASALAVALLVGVQTGWFVNNREPLILNQATTEQITFNPAEEPIFLASISPDNKYLAYADLGGIHLRDMDTGETHLLPVPEGFCYRCPNLTWFPNGKTLLASGPAGPDQASSIWSISIVGHELRKLRDNAEHASPSPDGSLVAFITADKREIWLMNANGDEPRKLLGLDRDATFFQVSWSPDGRRVAYLKINSDADEHVIEAYDMTTGPNGCALVGQAAEELRLDVSRAHHWSLGHPLLECVQTRAHGSVGRRRSGRACPLPPQQLANFAGFQASSLSVTADGNRLALVRNYDQSDVYVGEFVANASRLNVPRRLTVDDRIDWPGGWTRDSKAIFFYSDRLGTLDLFKQTVDGMPDVTL